MKTTEYDPTVSEILNERELKNRARLLLRLNSVELFDDPRSEIEVALALGFLSVPPEVEVNLGLREPDETAV